MSKRTLFIIVIGVVIALFFRKFLFEMIYVASHSMEPTLSVKEQLIVNKYIYKFKPIKRWDIIVFSSPFDGKEMVKRVIGLPGEKIELYEKKVYIDDQMLEEDYVQFVRPDELLVGDNIEPFIIDEDNYFVIGDNRDVSRDSRDWSEEPGPQIITVPKLSIKGKVVTDR